MTAFRLMSLTAHGAMELLIGVALIAAPFVLGFGAPAMVAAVVVGALTVGLALSAAVADTGPVDIGAHYTLDIGLSLGLLGAALALAAAGDGRAAAVFVGAAVAELALNLTTRYSSRR